MLPKSNIYLLSVFGDLFDAGVEDIMRSGLALVSLQ